MPNLIARQRINVRCSECQQKIPVIVEAKQRVRPHKPNSKAKPRSRKQVIRAARQKLPALVGEARAESYLCSRCDCQGED